MAKIKIVKMEKEMPTGTIDCGNTSINSMIDKSYYPTILQHAYGFYIYFDEKIVGAYMLKFAKINLEECPEDISDYISDMCRDCFSLHIKYIAVDEKYQRRGIGQTVLKYIVKSVKELCGVWPIRLITLDALKSKYDWYSALGFVAFNEKDLYDNNTTVRMYLDCLMDVEVVNNYCSLT